MSIFSQFYTWFTGDTITAARLNGNINSIVTAGNNIDNQNIGAAGIYASQMKPTSGAQATFGGAVGYTINPNATGQIPLTIAAPSGQTVDILDVTLNAVKVLDIDSVGDTEVGGNLELLATSRTSATDVALWNDNGATNGLVLNVPTGSTNGFQFMVNAVAKALISAAGLGTFVGLNAQTGTVKGASDGATNTFMLPVYTAGGAAVASTIHAVFGQTSLTFSSSTASNTVVVTLSGAAQFTSGTSYNVIGTMIGDNGGLIVPNVTSISASGFTLAARSTLSTNGSFSVAWLAIGT